MSKLNELRHGTIDEAMYYLDETECTEMELRAALLNAFRRIQQLEIAIEKLQERPKVGAGGTPNLLQQIQSERI